MLSKMCNLGIILGDKYTGTETKKYTVNFYFHISLVFHQQCITLPFMTSNTEIKNILDSNFTLMDLTCRVISLSPRGQEFRDSTRRQNPSYATASLCNGCLNPDTPPLTLLPPPGPNLDYKEA